MSTEIPTDQVDADLDTHVRRGPRGFPLLPGGMGRSAYYTGSASPYALRGEGCLLYDDRGRELIDANNNFTTLIHGNAHPQIIEAATRALKEGSCWGIPNDYEWQHAELMIERLPDLDQVRYTNSGTEAVMTAVRLARAVSGRDGVLMTKSGYHGSSDVALSIGSAQDRQGIPEGVTRDVTAIPLNDINALEQAIADRPGHYGAIVLDLLPNKAGLLAISEAFVKKARALATEHSIILIIDEVISLRLGYNGLSGEYGIVPDLVTTGKLIGGGLPVGALAGREEIMRALDPQRPGSVPQSGTFSGNPASMAAGAEALRLLTADEVARLNRLGDGVRAEIATRIADSGWEIRGRGSLMRPFPRNSAAFPVPLQQKLWWAAYERGLLMTPANLAALTTPMTEKVVADLGDRLADAMLSVPVDAN